MSKRLDLVGQRFGRLTVTAFAGVRHGTRWLCACDCGTSKEVLGDKLRSGATQSCGCYMRECRTIDTFELIGIRVGRLVVVSRAGSDRKGARLWKCVCDCGATRTATSYLLRHEEVKSCGCLRYAARRHGHSHSHGGRASPTYRSWYAMIQRCTNPRDKRWPNYGGRGITICAAWRTFDAFLADVGERPAGTSIDRINNDGNYEPGNCRWTTADIQIQNSRHTKLTVDTVLEIRRRFAAGETARPLAEEFGVSRNYVSRLVQGHCWAAAKIATKAIDALGDGEAR